MGNMFELEIHLGNAAMNTRHDVARKLRDMADSLDRQTAGRSGHLLDDNGNWVGQYGFITTND